MPQTRFPHLQLIFRERGEAKLEGGGSADPAVQRNKAERRQHAEYLASKATGFTQRARALQQERQQAGLPAIAAGVPFVVQIPEEDDGAIEFLAEKLGLEVVAEYEDGFVIVSSEDLELARLTALAADFAQTKRGATGMANILGIEEDPLSEGRLRRILDEALFQRWPFPDAEVLTLDLSIEVAAFGAPPRPRMGGRPTSETRARKEAQHDEEKHAHLERWERKRMQREEEIERFVAHYGGEICSISDDSHVVEFPDSFSMRVKMRGQGFKDLIQNYPNLFEVASPDEVQSIVPQGQPADRAAVDFELLPPPAESPRLCVIDSGIEEGHRWLNAAIDRTASRCFIPDKQSDDVADHVTGGGHGTRVAGACLYPDRVPTAGTYQPRFWLLNVRVLDENNRMSARIFPAELLREIVATYKESRNARIFQHSIAGNCCCRSSRMSVWAAAMDLLSYEKDVLFIQAVGNLCDRNTPANPGILDHIAAGRAYPDYLYEPASRLSNPAQSLQALTVGSISAELFRDADRQSLAPAQGPSAFSRTGFGLWDSIKPEVVEFGGDNVIDGGNPPSLTTPPQVCPELIRSTARGGPPFDRDATGTSFAAPKVAHIAGQLAALFPDQSTLCYRALIVNSARWPTWAEDAPVTLRPRIVKSIGYGVPHVSRATENNEHRITLITAGDQEIRACEGLIFGVPIPEALRRQGDDYRIRIDVTLSYAAQPRRTRKSRRGYLNVWLDWKTSKKREQFDTFHARALKDTEGGDGVDDGNFPWTLGNKRERDGLTDGVSRRNGTVQKDWAVVHSYDLPDVFGVVVRGHEGWDRKNPESKARFALAVSFEVLGTDLNVYEQVRAAVEAEVTAGQARVQT